MKIMEVVCGALCHHHQYLIAKRGQGIHEDTWEFPGGKVEVSESNEDAIIRELKEELDIDIKVECYLTSIEDCFDDTILHVHAYLCSIVKGTPALHVHKEMKWVTAKELSQFAFREADKPIIELIQQKERDN